MATKKNNPKAATRTRKADKKEKVTPAIKASARTKKKDMKLPEGQFVIRGTVRDSNGKLVAKATVLAFDCDLRNKQQLGKDVVTVTDADGRYEIRYTMKEFAAGDSTPNASPDLLVRIVDANNKDKVLAESPTRFNAGREETIDLVIAAPALSEWVIISQAVIPLLISQGLDGKPLPPWELNDEDISFIVKETGLDREQVRLWVLAIKTAREVVLITPLPSSGLPSNWHSHHHTGEGGVTGTEAGDLLELIVFYGWFRDGQPQVFAELMRRSTDDLMTSLARAITQRYIPAIDQQLKDSLRKTLDARRIDDVLKPAKEGEPASIGDVLGTISSKQLPPEKTKIVAGILLHTKHEDADFLEKLAKAGIDNSQAIQVRRTLRIGKLTTDHVPMIKALQPLVADAADDSLTALTSIALDQWLDLAYTHGTPVDKSLTAEEYALSMERSVETLAPTAVLNAKFKRQQIKFTQPGFDGITKVLDSHPTFDIMRDDLITFAESHDIPSSTLKALGTLQQFKRLDAQWEEVTALVNHGLENLEHITQYGLSQFKTRFSDIAEDARLEIIYTNAMAIQATGIAMLGYLQPLLFGVAPEVLLSIDKDEGAKSTIEKYPTLRSLFGALDTCVCDPCLSVLSPAAYLVDLLKFIDANHEAGIELKRRRPDIYDLELSCDNTQIELPHIDLVNEILEGAIVFPYQINLPPGVDPVVLLQNQRLDGDIRNALQQTANDPLGTLAAQPDQWSLRPKIYNPGVSYWVITDEHRRWVLKAIKQYFGLKSNATLRNNLASTFGANIEQACGELDKKRIPTQHVLEFYRLLADSISASLPFAMVVTKIDIENASRQWLLTFDWSIIVSLNKPAGTITISDGKRQNVTMPTTGKKYSPQTLDKIERDFTNETIPKVIKLLLSPDALSKKEHVNYQIQPDGADWKITITRSESVIYNPASLDIEGLSYQSSASSRDLFTSPQNHNPLAAHKLASATAVFPWTLPYDRNLIEMRETLSAAGIPRLSLLAQSNPLSECYASSQLARERLGLSTAEWDIIVSPHVDTNGQATTGLFLSWGFNVTSINQKAKIRDSYIDAEIEELPLGSPGALLTRVSIVLQQARLSFNDLQQLLNTDTVNPGNTVTIVPPVGCKPNELRLYNVTPLFFDRLHRFVRLWRVTGWQIWELDLALQAPSIGNNNINESALVQIANLGILKERLSLSIEILATILAGFSAKKNLRADSKGQLLEAPPMLVCLMPNESARSAGDVATALGMRIADFEYLLNDSALDTPKPNNATIATDVSRHWAFRNVMLIKALQLSIPDYMRMWRLFGAGSFATTDKLLALLDQVDFVQKSGFSWSELDYVLLRTGNEENTHPLQLSKQNAAETLIALKTALQQIQPQQKPPRDITLPSGSGRFKLALQQYLQLEKTVIESWWTTPAPADRTTVLAKAMGLSEVELQRLIELYVHVSGLVHAIPTVDPWRSDEDLLNFVEDSVELKSRLSVVIEQLAKLVDMQPSLITKILWEHLLHMNKPAMFFLASPSIKNLPSDSTEFYALALRLHKIATLNKHWQATQDELDWLCDTNPPRYAGMNLAQLPAMNQITPVPAKSWQQSTALFQLAHLTSGMTSTIAEYLAQFHLSGVNNPSKAARNSLDKVFGFDLTGATTDECADWLGMVYQDMPKTVEAHLDPLRLVELTNLLGLLQRLGIGTDIFKVLRVENPSLASVRITRQLLRSRNGDDNWKSALTEINNRLRSQWRDRMVDYLLARDGERDAMALYERYLIDTQMSPCMNTTRLLQSTSAAQLFVQRGLFNLESIIYEVLPENYDQKRWEWMQNYRVWEANRKVFLYPENWLFPEVRDDRTETFRAFESALTQSEPSHENAVKALRQYLDDLVDVSQISVMGMYEHAEATDERDAWGNKKIRYTLYLVGRTPNPPYVFFWRKAVNYREPSMRWMGWERIDQDLVGDHVIPFVFEGDLHIAWPLIRQIEKNSMHYYEVQLAWARKTSTGWAKRKTSTFALKQVKVIPNRSDRTNLAFRVDYRNYDSPRIMCYAATSELLNISNGKSSVAISEDGNTAKASDLSEVTLSYSAILVSTAGTRPLSPTEVTIKAKGVKQELVVIDSYYDIETDQVENETEIRIFAVRETGTVVLSSDDLPLTVYLHTQSKFSLIAEVMGQPPANVECNFSYARGKKYTANVELQILETKAIEPTDSTPLVLKLFGKFIFKHGEEVSSEDGNPEKLDIPKGTLSALNGYLQEPSSGADGLTGVTDISRPEPFFALSASSNRFSPYHTWYLEEAGNRFFLRSHTWEMSEQDSTLRKNASVLLTDVSIFPSQFRTEAAGLVEAFSVSFRSVFDLQCQNSVRNDFLSHYYRTYQSDDPRNWTTPGFDLAFAYSCYNWEVFYHLPLAAATFLSRQHRFEDARRWFHFIFDPTTNDSSPGRKRFWRFLPFRNAQAPDTITQLLEALANPDANPSKKNAVKKQVAAWLEDPFNPFAVARLRPSAFEWYTVTSYIKNLIAWADQLFRRDTRESINEASLLYIMAAQILGKRPEKIKRIAKQKKPKSYRAFAGSNNQEFHNLWITLSNMLTVWQLSSHPLTQEQLDKLSQLASVGSLYFCVPPNEKLPELWDTVDDRLFKIRHCQNIEGVTRNLPLFEPPIDPELLIRAKAAGLDLADVLADRFAPLPYYRFQVLLQKANEFCNEVKGLGAALLSAIEKKEAEHLSLLRSRQEIDMLKLIESVKEEQIKEAQANIEALNKTRSNTIDRFVFLQRQLGKNQITFDASGSPIVEQSLIAQVQETGAPDGFSSLSLIQSEIDQIRYMELSNVFSIIAGATRFSAGVTHLAGVTFATKIPAEAIGFALSAAGDAFGTLAGYMSFLERRSSQIGGWQRRRDEWVQQSRMTAEEIRQINKQIIALEIRKSIAGKELDNHRKQIEYAANIDDYMRHLKFTGESLYAWMESQLAGLYFSAYQMAYELAKRAERAFHYELGDETGNYIRYGHWDSLRKGLLSGDRLSQDLRRMESAYLDRNKRELEITKHISLRQLDAEQLMALRRDGSCEFTIPEVLFDLDFPGHYFRRIKSVSVSVPCVVGPYTSVSGTLTLLSCKLREKNIATGSYDDEGKYRTNYFPIQSIATSTAQNDGGMFELNFRDERYLPFEGAGAISTWRFTLPKEFRSFDYNTISDLLLHVRYTARDGGGTLATAVLGSVRTKLDDISGHGLLHMISLRNDCPTEWSKLKTSNSYTTEISIRREHLPYLVAMQPSVKISKVNALIKLNNSNTQVTGISLALTPPTDQCPSITFDQDANMKMWLIGNYMTLLNLVDVKQTLNNSRWTLTLTATSSGSPQLKDIIPLLDDMILLVGYKIP